MVSAMASAMTLAAQLPFEFPGKGAQCACPQLASSTEALSFPGKGAQCACLQ